MPFDLDVVIQPGTPDTPFGEDIALDRQGPQSRTIEFLEQLTPRAIDPTQDPDVVEVTEQFHDRRIDLTSSSNGHESPAAVARRSVSRTVDGAAPTRTAIDLWPSPCSARYLSISRTRRISSLSAGIPFLPHHHRRKELHTGRTPTPHPIRRGRHHLGTRGRLILGTGGRDHFGIRGRIASEFAHELPVD